MRKLKINGSITTDIRSVWVKSKQQEFFFNSLNIPRLTDEQKLPCEGSITEEECVKALQSFQGNKAPGNDGLPIEFYSKLWEIISEPFVNCVNEIEFSLVVKCHAPRNRL